LGLQLYRRHRSECEAKCPEDSKTGKFEEAHRGWKKCRCQIYASGTLGEKFKRQTTDKWEYPNVLHKKPGALAGSTRLAQWRQAGCWPASHDRLWLALTCVTADPKAHGRGSN
jgi:hypothetical protein